VPPLLSSDKGVSATAHNPRKEICMATKNQALQSSPVAQMPEGFRRLGSVANAGWFNMKQVGNVLSGALEGMFERNDSMNKNGKSKFFQIRISSPCQVRMGKGEDAAIVTANAGDFVNLNYGPKTKMLEDYIAKLEQGAAYEVYGSVCGEKIKLSGGRTMHNFDLGVKMTKAPRPTDEEPDFEGTDEAEAATA
jgi:hypothetical protein